MDPSAAGLAVFERSTHIVVFGEHGERLAPRLGIPWLVEASDGDGFRWGDDRTLVLEQPSETRVACADSAAMRRALAVCSELGLAIRVESPGAVPKIATSEREEKSEALESRAVYRLEGSTKLVVDCDETTGAIVAASIRGGRVLERATHREGSVTIERFMRAFSFLEGRVSQRVLAWCDAERVIRDPGRTCSRYELAAELERLGAPAPEAVLEVESDFGGLFQPNASNPAASPVLSLGIWGIVTGPESTRRVWRENGEGSDWLENDAWPRLRWRNTELLPAGSQTGETDLLVDHEGAVYAFVPELDRLTLAAATMRAFVEQLALRWETRRAIPDIAEVTLDADVGDALARRLGVPAVPEASDRVWRHYRSDTLWIWSTSDIGPNRARTSTAARTPELMVEAVRAARELAPKAEIDVAVYRPGGRARLDALLAAGLPARY